MHRQTTSRTRAIAFAAISLALPAQAQAQQWIVPFVQAALTNPFGRDFIDLTQEDLSLLTAAMRTVLEKRSVGAQQSWTNEKSQHAGVASLVKVYEQDGKPCGTVHHDFTAGNGKPYLLSLCKFEDGTWKIMP
jgi:hypothetical protein